MVQMTTRPLEVNSGAGIAEEEFATCVQWLRLGSEGIVCNAGHPGRDGWAGSDGCHDERPQLSHFAWKAGWSMWRYGSCFHLSDIWAALF